MDKWIWVDKKIYPDNQVTKYSYFHENGPDNFAVAEFKREYVFDKKVVSADLYFSGDTRFQLYLNGEILTTGPVMVGGDWLGNNEKRSDFYATHMVIEPMCSELNFFARVLMMPIQMCDYSMGHGGFMLRGEVLFEDGTKKEISTDKSWLARKCNEYVEPFLYDARVSADKYARAEEVEDIWNCKIAPIPPMTEEIVLPSNDAVITVKVGEAFEKTLNFDKIYAGYLSVSVKTKGEVNLLINTKETDEEGYFEKITFTENSEYRSFKLYSIGKLIVNIENKSEEDAEISIRLISRYYPIKECGKIVTSDAELNKVLDVCMHTLKFCRQSIHLDSPRHCEPLACTGDYYVETLMTMFSFGNMELAKFDIRRTAGLLRENDGRIFHTTYSLIWTYWLWDAYMITGEKALLVDCADALDLLLGRFETYIGENGLIETPPDYMFVDWIYIDELSMHHPPKALGQTSVNMFYYKAFQTSAKIYAEIGCEDKAELCRIKAKSLKNAVNSLLFDDEKKMYFEGLNTPTSEHLIDKFMPRNTEKRYYLKHSNILAAYTEICDFETARNLIKKVMNDEIKGDVQPYFLHYLLEAVFQHGMCEEYTLRIIEKWKTAIKECDKGLVEGFVAPEPTYSFDHSHAWGGTPLYSLPKALLGFEIVKPGMVEIKINVDLLGLEYADVEMPTPFGRLSVSLKNGENAKIMIPEGIIAI